MAGEATPIIPAQVPQSPEAQFEAIFAKQYGEDKAPKAQAKEAPEPPPEDDDDDEPAGNTEALADDDSGDVDTADDAPAEADGDAPADDAEAEEVEFAGKKHKLPKEIAEVIKKAGNLDKNYTQKTQELATLHKLAEDRVHFADFQAQVMQHAFKEAAEVQALQTQIAQIDAIDWNSLIVNDSQRAMQLNIARQQLGTQLAAKQQVLTDVGARMRAAKEQHDAKQKELGSAELTRRVGKLDSATVQKMGDLGQRLGLKEADFMSPAVLQALHMAAKYEAIAKAKPGIDKRVRDAKPMAPASAPAARSTVKSAEANKVVDLQKRYQKTGSAKDVEAYLATVFARKRK